MYEEALYAASAIGLMGAAFLLFFAKHLQREMRQAISEFHPGDRRD